MDNPDSCGNQTVSIESITPSHPPTLGLTDMFIFGTQRSSPYRAHHIGSRLELYRRLTQSEGVELPDRPRRTYQFSMPDLSQLVVRVGIMKERV